MLILDVEEADDDEEYKVEWIFEKEPIRYHARGSGPHHCCLSRGQLRHAASGQAVALTIAFPVA